MNRNPFDHPIDRLQVLADLSEADNTRRAHWRSSTEGDLWASATFLSESAWTLSLWDEKTDHGIAPPVKLVELRQLVTEAQRLVTEAREILLADEENDTKR
jgi:hypothetical protein